MKPYAESSEVNKVPILAVLREIFAEHKRVLEIASGTGQHAVYFGRELPHLIWQPSELAQHLPGILAWLDEAQLPNVLAPLAIDVNDACWPVAKVDAIFNANTVHIISWPEVQLLFAHIARVIEPGGCVCLWAIQLQREIHLRKQCPLRCLAQVARPEQRRAGFRSGEPTCLIP